MKIEIQAASNDPAISLLQVYTDSMRPVCSIHEDDLCEILNDAQIARFCTGEYKFNVNKEALFQKAKTIYSTI